MEADKPTEHLEVDREVYKLWCQIGKDNALGSHTHIATFLIQSYQSSRDGSHPLGKTCIHCNAPLVLVCLSCDLHRQQDSQQHSSSQSAGERFLHSEIKSNSAEGGMDKNGRGGTTNSSCKEDLLEEVTLTELAPATLTTEVKGTSPIKSNTMACLQSDMMSCQTQASTSSVSRGVGQSSDHFTDLDSGMSHAVPHTKVQTSQQTPQTSSGFLGSPDPKHTMSENQKTQAEVLERKLVESTIVVSDSKFYCCIECQQEFQTETRMRLHLQQHLNYRPHVCEYCSASFLLRNQLNVHTLKKHPDRAEEFFNRVKEENYNKAINKFLNEEEGKHPEQTSSQATSSSCAVKAESTGTLENIVEKSVKASEVLVDGVKGYCCIECGQKFSQRYSMKRHFETHVNYRPNSCPHCPATFHQHYHLQRHIINTHHSILDTSPNSMVPRDRLNLQSRELQMRNEARMFEESMIVVNGVDSFSCRLCGERYTHRSSLVRHIHTHTQDRKYSCNDCGKAFNRLAHLKRHSARMHQSARNFVCGLCSASFADNYHLTRHEATHTKHQPHKCTDCGAAFTNTRQLKSHQVSHHPGTSKTVMETFGTQTRNDQGTSMSVGRVGVQGEDMTWLNLSARPPIDSKPASIMQKHMAMTKPWEIPHFNPVAELATLHSASAMIKPPF